MKESEPSSKTLGDRYEAKLAETRPRLDAFARGDRPWLVVQAAPLNVYTRCNTVDEVVEENLKFFERQLDLRSDWLPYLEPWMGTGIVANAFGAPWVWREGDSPAVHYRCRTIEEAVALPPPSIDKCPMMNRVLETLAAFHERTDPRLPIALTDTQSPNDNATLILDACEVFITALEQPELLHRFQRRILKTIIDFSKRQIEVIGKERLAHPGHIMVSAPGWTGLSVSDDNLAVVSPEVGRPFCLAYHEPLAEAFDGLALHSCGRWQHLMPEVARMKRLVQADCAIHLDADPNPNDPEAVRDAFAGAGVPVKVRGPNSLEEWMRLLPRLLHRDLRLIVHLSPPEDLALAAEGYDRTDRYLETFFGG